MALFRYKAARANGSKVRGSIDAAHLDEAKQLLREQGLIILSIWQTQHRGHKTYGLSMSFDQQVVFVSQLAQLVSADVPLYESLEALEEQSEGESYQGVIFSLREQIRKGSSFSMALSHFPHIFSPLFRALIVAGESVGRLDQALTRLGDLLSSERRSKHRMISALLYPAILVILLFVVLIIMIFFVVPSMESLFENQELPLLTRIVLTGTRMVRNHVWFLAIAGFATIFVGIMFRSKGALREKFAAYILRWPFLGPYLLKSSLSRFARTLSNLLLGGTPLSSALEFASQAIGNTLLEHDIHKASKRIIDGETFSSALRRSKHLPPLFVRMVTVGEESGRLAPILLNVAKLYEEDSERILERMMSLIQPILLVIIGVVIGLVLFAILLPLANFGSTLAI